MEFVNGVSSKHRNGAKSSFYKCNYYLPQYKDLPPVQFLNGIVPIGM